MTRIIAFFFFALTALAVAAGDSGRRQIPTSLADVSQALTALDERLAAGGERIAVGCDVLSAIELFECVGDLSIDLRIDGDSVISQEQPFRARITE